MKVLHLCPRYPPSIGGSERTMKVFSDGLVGLGHEVTVLTTNALEPDALFDDALEHVAQPEQTCSPRVLRCRAPESGPLQDALDDQISARPSFRCESMLGFADSVQEGDFDLVHVTCFPFANLLHVARLASRRARCRMILTPFMHTHPELARHFRRPVLRQFSQVFDAILCQSRHEESFFRDWGVERPRLHQFGLTVDTPPQVLGNGERFRETFAISNAKIVAHLATNDRLKGTETLLQVAPRLTDLDVCIVIAGNRTQKFDALLARTPECDRKNVRVLGVLANGPKHDLLDAMACLAIPSVAESFGLTYLEAWSYRKPVIGVDYGPVAELIDHGQSGWLVPFEDPQKLELAIRAYVEDATLGTTHGAQGERSLRQLDPWPEKVRQLSRLYEDVCSS